MLKLTDLSTYYGNIQALKGVSLEVREGEIITVDAYAREAESKKGQDVAQTTGSASSYARKYALNGLFLIDDTKDADATNDHGKKPASRKKPAIDPETTDIPF